MRGIYRLTSLFIVSLSSVLARLPTDLPEFSYTVDCSMARYDYVDAGRALNATYSAQTRSDCVKNCQTACGTSEMPNLDCLKKNDNLAGCSFFVKKTVYSGVHFVCNPSVGTAGVVLEVNALDMEECLEIPIYYAINITKYDTTGTNLPIYGISSVSMAVPNAPDYCNGDDANPTIPVSCSPEGNPVENVCDVTDVITRYQYYPDLLMKDSSQHDFYVTVIPTNISMTTPISMDNKDTYATYISGGMVSAIANSCSTHDNCNDCAAAKCNWCNNKDGVTTKSGYSGCGVSLEECEQIGYPFNNCDAYPKSGVMRSTGVISVAGLTVLAVLGLSL